MYTRCPHCQTCFRIAEAHIKAAKGMVRCGSCKEVFNATTHLYDTMPEPDPNELKANPIIPGATPNELKSKPLSPEAAPNEFKGHPAIPADQHEHIDLGPPPDRSNAPDQSKFMESILDERSRYNNLDEMPPISIPGKPDFSESFINFVNTEYDPEKKIPPPSNSKSVPEPATTITTPTKPLAIEEDSVNPGAFEAAETYAANPFISAFAKQQEFEGSNAPEAQPPPAASAIAPKQDTRSVSFPPAPLAKSDESAESGLSLELEPEEISQRGEYEDRDSVLSGTTSTDFKGIDDLYSSAMQQMEEPTEDPTEDPEKLNRDIEALLNDAMSLDDPVLAEPIRAESGLGTAGRGKFGSNKPAANELGTDELEPSDLELDLSAADEFTLNAPKQKTAQNTPFLDDINFLEPELEEPNEVLAQFEKELEDIEFSKTAATSFSLDNDDTLESLPAEDSVPFEDQLSFDDYEDDADKSEIVIKGIDPTPVAAPAPKNNDLPSADDELPRALRSSFEYLDRPERPLGVSILMGLGILMLVLTLLGQMVLFRSYQLANQFPSLTPMLASICETLPCRYSGSTDIKQIEVINRNVSGHPEQKNALLISTTFINKAPFNQPYPTIAIKLSDLSGHIVATRYFQPNEYFGEGLYNKFLLMETDTPVNVTLEVLDPGDDAINFEFSFI